MAQLTLTVNDAHVQRILEAFTDILEIDPEVGASAEDVRQFLVFKIKQMVMNYEKQVIESTEVDVS